MYTTAVILFLTNISDLYMCSEALQLDGNYGYFEKFIDGGRGGGGVNLWMN